MGLAKIEREMAANGQGCLGKAADDEPVFILRGQDKFAADLVDEWARQARLMGCDEKKVVEAEQLAIAMRAWPTQKYPD